VRRSLLELSWMLLGLLFGMDFGWRVLELLMAL